MNKKIWNGVNMPMKRDRFITSFPIQIIFDMSASRPTDKREDEKIEEWRWQK